MIPPKNERSLTGSAPDDSVAFAISETDGVHIMRILRSTLYSDKILAVIREYCSNATDANVEAGRASEPIKVHLPNVADPYFRVRDHGVGLTHEDVRKVFTRYGKSTKRETDAYIGMLGIGSKSGFAYGDSFTVTSWRDGRKRSYLAVLDETNAGRMDLMDNREDDGPSGVEVQLAVRPSDWEAFEDRAADLFRHFPTRPDCPGLTVKDLPASRQLGDLGSVFEVEEDRYSTNRLGWTVTMGPVPYKVDLDQLFNGGDVGERLGSHARNVSGLLPFTIGELTVAASREHLEYSDTTRRALIKRINAIIDAYVTELLKGIDAQTAWERRLRIRALERRNLPVPPTYRGHANNVELWFDPQLLGFGSISYRGHLQKVDPKAYHGPRVTVQVAPETRIVYKDDKRPIKGYKEAGSFRTYDIIMTIPVGVHPTSASISLKQALKAIDIEGIPIVKMSTLKWVETRETVKDARPRDPARARAKVLTLDFTKYLGGSAPSQGWNPAEITPSAKDVFVVLEGYRVPDWDSFYEAVQRDKTIVEKLGLKFPPVVGYKSTKANPVPVSKPKGVHYRTWRGKGLIELLMSEPRVATLVGILQIKDTFPMMDAKEWSEALGPDHALSMAAAESARAYAAATAQDQTVFQAARLVNNNLPGKHAARQAMDALVAQYPLFSMIDDDHKLFGEPRPHVLEYVRLADQARPPVPPKEETVPDLTASVDGGMMDDEEDEEEEAA